MPRKARIDAPGAVHHIIIRGIERRPIFRSDSDRADLLQRFGHLLSETQTECFAWALIPNHAHFLLRTALVPIAALMRRVLKGDAVSFNKKYRRHGKVISKSVQVDSVPGGSLSERAYSIYPLKSVARQVGEGFKSAGSVSLVRPQCSDG